MRIWRGLALMSVIIIDTSALIDLAKAGIIEEALSLPHEFLIPDVIFEDELISLGKYDKGRLLKTGLRIASLESEGVELVGKLQSAYKPLTIYDCFALALAEKTPNSILLTGDKNLKRAAGERKIKTHGVLWIIDRMMDVKSIGERALIDGLHRLESDRNVRLPKNEIRERIKRLEER
jgi:rRNA-processing protein FCF1